MDERERQDNEASEAGRPSEASPHQHVMSAASEAHHAPHKHPAHKRDKDAAAGENSEFIRAENEDDDGYDPYSDRRPEREPLFERDPWD